MRLLVPSDGSGAAHRALAYALWLAQDRPGSSIVLVNVQNRDTLALSDIDAAIESERAIAGRQSAKALRGAIKACEDAGIHFEIRSEFGPVCETIERVARDVHPDQIIMGTRGLSRITGLLLGSIAMGVVHRAHVPVTLVKAETHLPGSGHPERKRNQGQAQP
jgi:nucleotide-binding universal stress UspA family protein